MPACVLAWRAGGGGGGSPSVMLRLSSADERMLLLALIVLLLKWVHVLGQSGLGLRHCPQSFYAQKYD